MSPEISCPRRSPEPPPGYAVSHPVPRRPCMWGMENRIVLITGAGNGIGRATAALFAAQGATVLAADIEEAAAGETARAIAEAGGRAFPLRVDVSRSASVGPMVADIVGQFGRIDILHANAAVQVNKDVVETSEEEWDRLHNVNLKGVFLTCKSVVPVMRKQGGGAIVISSSGHAFATFPNSSAYAATKGGELAFMRGLALDCARDGIRVNCIIPGATDTRLLRIFFDSSPDPEAA